MVLGVPIFKRFRISVVESDVAFILSDYIVIEKYIPFN